jgi:hypothetical protein
LASTIEIGSLLIKSFQNLNSNFTKVIYEAQVKNIISENISNVNWSLQTDNENNNLDSQYNLNLSSNETAFIFIKYDYASGGVFNPQFIVKNIDFSHSKTTSIEFNRN